MLKKVKSLILALVVVAMGCISCDDNIVPAEQLPAAAQTYIQTNFPGSKVLIVKKDLEFLSSYYDVTLDNGVELSFTSDGLLRDVDD